MNTTTYRIDDTLTCPLCKRHNALVAQPGRYRQRYECRDCGAGFQLQPDNCTIAEVL